MLEKKQDKIVNLDDLEKLGAHIPQMLRVSRVILA